MGEARPNAHGPGLCILPGQSTAVITRDTRHGEVPGQGAGPAGSSSSGGRPQGWSRGRGTQL